MCHGKLNVPYVFVGERRSKLAIAKGWTWQDGRLAGKQLFDALKAIGIDPTQHLFVNLFETDELPAGTVVAMGRKVQRELDQRGVPHLSIVHPAARGSIRRKANYLAHLREVLHA